MHLCEHKVPKQSSRVSSSRSNGRRKSGYNIQQQSTNTSAVVGGSISRRMPIFNQRKRAVLTYFEPLVTITSASGPSVCGTYVFAANGLYDPNYTGAGHKAMGFDQMMSFYEHYTVHSCKITVIPSNTSATGAYVAVSRNASSTPITAATDLVENGNVEYQCLPIVGVTNMFNKMVLSLDIGKFTGTDDVLDNPELRGTSTTNPTEVEFFHVSAWNPYSAGAASVSASVLLEFDATFTEPREIPSS